MLNSIWPIHHFDIAVFGQENVNILQQVYLILLWSSLHNVTIKILIFNVLVYYRF